MNRKDIEMKSNVTDIKEHLSAILSIYKEMSDIMFEDIEKGRWIHFMIQRELEEVLSDLENIED